MNPITSEQNTLSRLAIFQWGFSPRAAESVVEALKNCGKSSVVPVWVGGFSRQFIKKNYTWRAYRLILFIQISNRGLLNGFSFEEAITCGVAAGIANTLTIGAGQFKREDFERLRGQVCIFRR
jgi:hypothetical protein